MLLLISANRLARLSKHLLIIQYWLPLGHNHCAKNVKKGPHYRTITKINIQPEIRLLHGCEYITLKTFKSSNHTKSLAPMIVENIPSQIWPHYINSAWVFDTLSSKHHKAFTHSSLKNLSKCLVGELIIT